MMIRLPWGRLEDITTTFLAGRSLDVVGSVSFEERSVRVPALMSDQALRAMTLLRIEDPVGSFPDYTTEIRRRTKRNLGNLRKSGIGFELLELDLLAMEDQLLDLARTLEEGSSADVAVLDISSLPKRYFSLLVKRFLISRKIRNLVVCYTKSGELGYTPDHLASDPLPCDHLPGFAASLDRQEGGLVVAIGFESLGMQSILDVYHERRRGVKFLVPFPPSLDGIRRQWSTLREFAAWEPDNVIRDNIETVATWDVELAFTVLERWHDDLGYLSLAPFGAKPHSLAMALFATANDCPLFYTQPRSYHPDYSIGVGQVWAYVVKWNGIACYQRELAAV